MFVAELDRPWLETPFLIQGFLIEDDQQVAQLREYCQTVLIDRGRSVGYEHARPHQEWDGSSALGSRPFYAGADPQPDDFAEICRHLRLEPATRVYRTAPGVRGDDNQSPLEQELLFSAPLVEDVKKTMRSIRDSMGSDITLALSDACPLVGEMARAVERNPDAMIWLARLKSTDQYSYDHAVDVSVHLMVFARFLGFPGKTVERLGLAGLMQDVGKVDIPPDILNKPGNLTAEEYNLVKSHVASSLEILVGKQDFGMDVLDIVASHHERADGSGYPRQLSGEKITLHAEMAGLIDTFCAMTRNRVYDSAVSSQKALEDLIRIRGSKFRDAVVDQFIQCIGIYPIGSLVELNSGEVGVVIQQNQIRRLKPRLLIVLGPDKTYERRPRTLDLITDPPTGTGEPYRIVRALPSNAYGINPAELYLE